MQPAEYPRLAVYRRTVAASYARLRAADDAAQAAIQWRAERDQLFREHPLSPLAPEVRAGFPGIPYASYDPAWRIEAALDFDVTDETLHGDLPEGPLRLRRIAQTRFTTPGGQAGQLFVYWIEGYGGGLFLPFGDATNGQTTYGGGRYLYDTIKGADLGVTATHIILDFNFAYHPSCCYDSRWVCPLPRAENRFPFPIPVGEQLLAADSD